MTSGPWVGPEDVPPGLMRELPLAGAGETHGAWLGPVGVGLKVVFDLPVDGWIDMHVELGEQKLHIVLSDVHIPFPDMLRWVEALCVGVQRCGFDLDDEGDTYYFDTCLQHWTDEVLFSVLVRDWEADNDAPLWWRPFEARLARRELVGVFYAALRAMALFPRPVQWGTEWAETHDGPDEAFPSGDPLRTIQSDLVEQWLALRQGKQAGD